MTDYTFTRDLMRQLYPRGSRVRLVRSTDPYTRLAPGELGTVSLVDDVGTVHVHWDSGSNLGLVPDADVWETV